MIGMLKRLRLPRYGLRTLFVVVTVFACWLGWEANWVRERRAAIQLIKSEPGSRLILSSERRVSHLFQEAPITIPFWRRWMGDDALIFATIVGGSEIDLDHMWRLFPEAEMIIKEAVLGFDDADPYHKRNGAGIRARRNVWDQ